MLVNLIGVSIDVFVFQLKEAAWTNDFSTCGSHLLPW